VRLFRNGRNQALRIPRELEVAADEAIVRKDGDRLIVEPVRKGRLLALLAALRFGAAKSGSAKLADRVDLILSALDVLPLEAPADRHYGEIRQLLTRQGTPIGPNALLIAAHARALKLTAVTVSIQEFSRVPDLCVDNWLDIEPGG
jgi:tRNA(fMet)-specific endonuclease VapC